MAEKGDPKRRFEKMKAVDSLLVKFMELNKARQVVVGRPLAKLNLAGFLKNKVIGTRGQGVQVWCPRELTTEHLIEPSLRLD